MLKFKIYDTEDNLSIQFFSRTEKIELTNELITFLNKNSDLQYSLN